MTRVQTRHGWLEGERRGAHTVFRGIPFAKPPAGRFRAPEALEPWSGVRPAQTFGPSSVQAPSALSTATVPQPFSEDCLYLNVFTPAADSGKRVTLLGLVVGTAAGGMATGLGSLMAARVLAGSFGGPATALSLSIIADVILPSAAGAR